MEFWSNDFALKPNTPFLHHSTTQLLHYSVTSEMLPAIFCLGYESNKGGSLAHLLENAVARKLNYC